MKEMAVGNFREFATKYLHLESPPRKIRVKEGDNPTLRILRKLVAFYPSRNLLPRGLDSKEGESTKECLGEKKKSVGRGSCKKGKWGLVTRPT